MAKYMNRISPAKFEATTLHNNIAQIYNDYIKTITVVSEKNYRIINYLQLHRRTFKNHKL